MPRSKLTEQAALRQMAPQRTEACTQVPTPGVSSSSLTQSLPQQAKSMRRAAPKPGAAVEHTVGRAQDVHERLHGASGWMEDVEAYR